jgi:hypothetical protein
VLPEEHPQDQTDQAGEENQQKATQRPCHRALLFRLRPGNAEGSNEALHQKIQQSHVSLSIAPAHPDFLSSLLALMNFMRLSSMKAARVTAAWCPVQQIRRSAGGYCDYWYH